MSARTTFEQAQRGGRDAVARLRSSVRGGPAPHAASPVTPPGPAIAPSELQRRRDGLGRRLAELQWDLGGLAYEMAIRDHFRLDVLVRAAAELQSVDAELAETERLLRLEEAGAGGTCPGCSALHARGAPFCWRCGRELLPTGRGANGAQPTGPTAVP